MDNFYMKYITLPLLSVASNHVYGFIGDILLSFTQVFGYQLSLITDSVTIASIEQEIKYSTVLINGTKRHGYFAGNWIVGKLFKDPFSGMTQMSVLISTNRLNQIMKNIFSVEPQAKLDYWILRFAEIGGTSLTNQTILIRSLRVKVLTETKLQKVVITFISGHYLEHDNVVVVLSGPSGVGKSTVAKLLAQHLKGVVIPEIGLMKPGVPSLSEILARLYHSPAIVMIEEVDQMLKLLVSGKVDPHESALTQVLSKADWNAFWDKVDAGYFRGCIFVMTMNSSFEEMDALDPSLLRTGRVNFKIRMEEKKVRVCNGKGELLEEEEMD